MSLNWNCKAMTERGLKIWTTKPDAADEDQELNGITNALIWATSGGQLERANAKIARLTEVVGRLIEYVAKNDQQALDLVGSWQWELDK